MARKKKTIITNNREIYEKLNQLHFSKEVILTNTKNSQLTRILKNINKNSSVITKEVLDKYIILKKKGQTNYNIYLK